MSRYLWKSMDSWNCGRKVEYCKYKWKNDTFTVKDKIAVARKSESGVYEWIRRNNIFLSSTTKMDEKIVNYGLCIENEKEYKYYVIKEKCNKKRRECFMKRRFFQFHYLWQWYEKGLNTNRFVVSIICGARRQ